MAKQSPSAARKPSRRRMLSYAIVFAAGMFALLIGQCLFRASSTGAKGAPQERTGGVKGTPWGQLEITPLILERPEGVFQQVKAVGGEIRWVFPHRTQKQVADLIMACDLTAEQKYALLDPPLGESGPEGWTIRPPVDVVKAMSASTV